MFLDVISSLGINLGTWALLLVIAWYLFRGARAGKRAGSLLGRVVSDLVLLLVTAAVAMALGWANLDLPRLMGDVSAGVSWLVATSGDLLGKLLGGVPV